MAVKRGLDAPRPFAVHDLEAIGAAQERAIDLVTHPRYRLLYPQPMQIQATRRCGGSSCRAFRFVLLRPLSLALFRLGRRKLQVSLLARNDQTLHSDAIPAVSVGCEHDPELFA
jgi:hypothetical protein